MKKIILIAILISVSFGFAQQQQYNLGFEPGTPSGILSNWATFENPNPVADIVTNPSPNGTNTSSTTKVLKLNMVQGAACYGGAVNFHSTLGTWNLNSAILSNKTLTMQVNKSIVGKVGIKFGNATNGTVFEIKDNQGLVSTVNQWVTLSWDISTYNAVDNVNIDQMVIFIDWRCTGEVARPSDVQLLVDNISWGANKLTDPAVPTCSDGIQNGDETGVDCGGTNCPVCILDPTVSAPSPLLPAANVRSVYSETYPAINTVSNFIFNAFQGAGTISEVDIQSNGNKSGKINGLSYYGAQWTATNVSSFSYVHLDYYATTSNNFNFYLIDQNANIPGGNSAEPRYSFGGTTPNATLVKGSWQSIFIPLSYFSSFNTGSFTYNLNNIFQWKFDGNGTVYFDNIYFSTTNLATSTFESLNVKMYPNPANSVLNIDAKSNIDTVSIYNLLGQEVVSKTINNQNTSIDISNLQRGVYVVKTSIEGKIATSKLIKE